MGSGPGKVVYGSEVVCDGGDCEWKLAGVELGREDGMGDGGESREGGSIGL